MRIISGTFKGRQLRPPKNLPTRPTTNFAKESIFNIIGNHFDYDQLTVLDLFCGTGNIAVEFISRGVASVTAIDINSNCIGFLKDTCQLWNIDNLHLIRSDVFRYLKGSSTQYDVIFADPPYDMEGIEALHELIFNGNLLKNNGWFILEHAPSNKFNQLPHFREHRKYGHVNFSVFTI